MDNLSTDNQAQTTGQSHSSIPKIIPLEDVVYYTGLSSTTIYDMLNKKSKRYDSTFPIQIKISKGRVAWLESEIAEWLNDKITARVK